MQLFNNVRNMVSNHKLEAIYKNMFLYDTHYPMIPFQGDNNHMQILHIMNSL